MSNTWSLNYAPHISFRGRGLFADSAGDDPVDQVNFAADQGFAGVQDVIASQRSSGEQTRIGDALAARGLKAGCFGLPLPKQPFEWAGVGPEEWPQLRDAARAGIDIARRIHSQRVAVVSAATPLVPKWMQLSNFAENLKVVADVLTPAGITLVLEATDERRLPGMLMQQLQDAYFVVRMANHEGVRLIFDTGHSQAMDGSLITNFRFVRDLVAGVQIADVPGRLEPGAGEINFETFFAELIGQGIDDLVELEHLWSEPGAETEAKGLRTLRELDARAAARAGK